MNSPSPRKIDGNRVIYRSKELRTARTNGPPTLIDFGKARIGEPVHFNNIQPFIYRAPEVLLEMPWDKKVDIWNLGVMVSYYNPSFVGIILSSSGVCLYASCRNSRNRRCCSSILYTNSLQAWNLFEGTLLFERPRDSNVEESGKRQLARMVALLGQPPKDFLRRTTSMYFDENGA
jgi:serine/threonine-protein kinase SRPK3